MENEMVFKISEDGTLAKYEEPYTTTECETEEDYNKLLELIEKGKQAESLEKRLQISPQGDDKIDELEANINYLKFHLKEELEKLQNKVLLAVVAERERQKMMWGQEDHLPQFWTGILGEEYGEFCQAVNETVFDNGSDKGGYDNVKREAIHVAAVAVSFLEALERNKIRWFGKKPAIINEDFEKAVQDMQAQNRK